MSHFFRHPTGKFNVESHKNCFYQIDIISFIGYTYCMFKIIKCEVLDAGVQQGGDNYGM